MTSDAADRDRRVPLISVLTPTWKRAALIERVWSGLMAQSSRDFEWIVADDGSDDGTGRIVEELAACSDFPIIVITASRRIGKARMDNEAVAAARGRFVVWCDSDDYLLPHALETLLSTWDGIPEEQQAKFCGVSALCTTEDGPLGRRFYESRSSIDLAWVDMYRQLRADHVFFMRSDLIKAQRFLEVDFMISESTVWSRIGHLRTRFVPDAVKMVHYRQVNALSFSGHMSYNRAHAHASAMTRDVVERHMGSLGKLQRAVTFLRYASHGDIGFAQARRLWAGNLLDEARLLVSWPAAQILAFRDRKLGKVRKTHLEFERARQDVQITTRTFMKS